LCSNRFVFNEIPQRLQFDGQVYFT
jgi:hypothetical protein